MQNGGMIIAFDGRGLVPAKAEWVAQGTKPSVLMRTRLGREIKTTWTHPYLTKNGWKKVQDLSIGDKIAVPTHLPYFGTKQVPEHESGMVGLWLAEGNSKLSSVKITSNTYGDQIEKWANHYDGITKNVEKRKGRAKIWQIIGGPRNKKIPNRVQNMLRGYGLNNLTSATKHIPEDVFTWDRPSIAHMLRWLFNGDGWLADLRSSSSGFQVGFCSKSKQLVEDVSHLLLRFGIVGRMRQRKECNAWVWETNRYFEVRRFVDHIGIDRPAVESVKNHVPVKQKARWGVIEYDPIVEIIAQEEVPVYDLIVPYLHNFIANDIIAHNTDMTKLARAMSNVLPVASSMGIGMDEVSAGLAAMTAQGFLTNEASTAMRQAFVESSKTGTDLDKAIRKLTGKSMRQLTKEGKKAFGVLNQLRESMPDQEFADLFGSIEAANSAMSLTGPNWEMMSRNLEDMTISAGATDAAFDTMADTVSFRFQRTLVSLQATMTQLGLRILPMLTKAMDTLLLPALEAGIIAIDKYADVASSVFARIKANWEDSTDANEGAPVTFWEKIGEFFRLSTEDLLSLMGIEVNFVEAWNQIKENWKLSAGEGTIWDRVKSFFNLKVEDIMNTGVWAEVSAKWEQAGLFGESTGMWKRNPLEQFFNFMGADIDMPDFDFTNLLPEITAEKVAELYKTSKENIIAFFTDTSVDAKKWFVALKEEEIDPLFTITKGFVVAFWNGLVIDIKKWFPTITPADIDTLYLTARTNVIAFFTKKTVDATKLFPELTKEETDTLYTTTKSNIIAFFTNTPVDATKWFPELTKEETDTFYTETRKQIISFFTDTPVDAKKWFTELTEEEIKPLFTLTKGFIISYWNNISVSIENWFTELKEVDVKVVFFTAKDNVIKFWNGLVVSVDKWFPDLLESDIKLIFNLAKTNVLSYWNGLVVKITDWFDGISVENAKTTFETSKTNTISYWNGLVVDITKWFSVLTNEKIKPLFDTTKINVLAYWDGLVVDVASWFSNLSVEKVGEMFTDTLTAITDYWDTIDLTESGKKMLTTLTDGIKAFPKIDIWAAFSAILLGIRNMLPFSDAKEGPLQDLTAAGKSFITTLIAGMETEGPTLSTSIQTLFADAMNTLMPVLEDENVGKSLLAGGAGYLAIYSLIPKWIHPFGKSMKYAFTLSLTAALLGALSLLAVDLYNKGPIYQKINEVIDELSATFDTLIAKIDLIASGKSILTTLKDGFTDSTTRIELWDAFWGAMQGIRNLLPFSDAKEGPLKDLEASGTAFITTFIDGMLDGAADLYQTVMDIFAPVVDFIGNVFNPVNWFGGIEFADETGGVVEDRGGIDALAEDTIDLAGWRLAQKGAQGITKELKLWHTMRFVNPFSEKWAKRTYSPAGWLPKIGVRDVATRWTGLGLFFAAIQLIDTWLPMITGNENK